MRAASLLAALILLPGVSCEKQSKIPPTPPEEPPRDDDATRHHQGAKPEGVIQHVPVQGNVHMLLGRGGNIGVSVGQDGILIIDDQFEELAPEIVAALGKLSRGKLVYVLNTHHHGDHTGGNPVFGKDATIVAHENVRKRLAGGGKTGAALPIITFDSRLSIHFNGEEIRAVHLPHGHTDGDSVIFFTGSNVIHMGDHFFNGRFPYVDLGGGGDVAGYLANVETVRGLVTADTKIIPGHGPLASPADLEAFSEMLTSTVAHVRKQMQSGKSLAQIQKAGLPGKYRSYDGGFVTADRWIETIVKSFSR